MSNSLVFNASALSQGAGVDVGSTVAQILDSQRGPEQVWQQQQADLTLQSTVLTSINTSLSTLQDKVNALNDVLGPITAKAANSSDAGVLTASAQTSATPGNHLLVVNNLATTGTTYTDPLANGTTSFLSGGNTSGSLSLQVGGAGGATHTVAITQGSNDTLNALASYINQQNWGVSANVVTDANGSRLALVSQTSGAPGALSITNNQNTSLIFHSSGGVNASLNIDGVPFSSTSNTVTGAIPGVTLNLLNAAPSEEVQLSIGADTSQATQAINDFVSAYNTVVSAINSQFTFNAATNSAGPLAGDSSLRSLQSSLLTDATYSIQGNNGYTGLASLGINMQDDGTLAVDNTKLSDTLQNHFTEFQNFFQNAGQTGFANNFNKDLQNLTDTTQGSLSLELTQNNTQQKTLTDQINDFEARLTDQGQQLTAKYSQVNALLQQYPLLLAQVQQQLATLPHS